MGGRGGRPHGRAFQLVSPPPCDRSARAASSKVGGLTWTSTLTMTMTGPHSLTYAPRPCPTPTPPLFPGLTNHLSGRFVEPRRSALVVLACVWPNRSAEFGCFHSFPLLSGPSGPCQLPVWSFRPVVLALFLTCVGPSHLSLAVLARIFGNGEEQARESGPGPGSVQNGLRSVFPSSELTNPATGWAEPNRLQSRNESRGGEVGRGENSTFGTGNESRVA